MDWVTACRPRMVPLWREPLCSLPRLLRLLLHLLLQLPFTTEGYSTSVLWIGQSALTPYPEQSFPWASSYSTSSTGSPIKCCDTRTSIKICRTLSADPSCYILSFFFSQNRNCLSDLQYITMRKCVKRLICFLKPLLKNCVLRCVFRISEEEPKDKVKLCGFRLVLFVICQLVSVVVWFVWITTETKHCWYLWVHDLCLKWLEFREYNVDPAWMRHTDLNFDTTHLWMNVFENSKDLSFFFTPLDYLMVPMGAG